MQFKANLGSPIIKMSVHKHVQREKASFIKISPKIHKIITSITQLISCLGQPPLSVISVIPLIYIYCKLLTSSLDVLLYFTSPLVKYYLTFHKNVIQINT